MQLTDFKVLTFDCYGTLIDWENGITKALQPLLAQSGKTLSRDEVLEAFARHEAAQETETPSMIYSELLAVVHSRIASEWGIQPSALESKSFGRSVPDWPAFSDSPTALQYLKKHYKLAILSNVDRESFQGSNARLQSSLTTSLPLRISAPINLIRATLNTWLINYGMQGSERMRSCTRRKVCIMITSRRTGPD